MPQSKDTQSPANLCSPLDDQLRLQHIQMLGTHNSYHVAKPAPLVKDWAYTHDPLPVQLEQQGVRSFEFDLHHRSTAEPIAVEHVQGFDNGSSCPNLGACLQLLKTWSDAHLCHHPLVVLLECKDELEESDVADNLLQLESEILAVWPRERLLVPDDVRGKHPSLKAALQAEGWPTLARSRGKLVLILYDKEEMGVKYRKHHPQLQGAVAFVFGEPGDADVATVLRDNPLAADLADLVKQRYVVRTFPEPTELEGRAALASGAHVVSTDFPVDRCWAPGYALHLDGGGPSRCNPVANLPNCTTAAVNAGQ